MNVLITHVFGHSNKGDWALLDSLLRCVRVVYPYARISGICRNPESEAKVFRDVVWLRQLGTSFKQGWHRRVQNFSGLGAGVMSEALGFRRRSKCLSALPSIFHSADLIIAAPGGYLEDSNSSIITNCVHMWLGGRARAPLILAPQSIGPLTNTLTQRFVGRLLGRAAAICVREPISLNVVQSLRGIQPGRVHSFSDMAFYFSDADQQAAGSACLGLGLGPNEPFVCATAIDWYYPFSSNPDACRQNYVRELAGTIKLLQDRFKMRTVLVRQIKGLNSDTGDDIFLSRIAADCHGAAMVLKDDLSPSGMRALFARSKLVLASRMHSGIFGLQMGVPTVALAYLPKSNGIMAALGLSDYVLEMSRLEAGELFDRACRALSSGDDFLRVRDNIRRIGERDRDRFCRLLTEATTAQGEPKPA